jgi:hypothetical protein
MNNAYNLYEKMQAEMTECGKCVFWVKSEKAGLIVGEPQQGECRANPPQLLVIPVQTLQGAGLSVQGHFPVTVETGYCGAGVDREGEETPEPA